MRAVLLIALTFVAALLLNVESVVAAGKAPVVVKKTPTTAPQTAQPQSPAPQPLAPASQPNVTTATPQPTETVAPVLENTAPVTVETSPKAGEEINWQVIASGGNVQTLGSFVLGSTIGQVAAGTSTVGDLTLQSGFWQNFGVNYLCGDLDGSGDIDIADAVYLVNYIFSGGPAPNPMAAGDTDCDGAITIADAVVLVNYIFAGGAAPCATCK